MRNDPATRTSERSTAILTALSRRSFQIIDIYPCKRKIGCTTSWSSSTPFPSSVLFVSTTATPAPLLPKKDLYIHIHTFTAAEDHSLILYYGRRFLHYDDHSLCRYQLLFDEAPGEIDFPCHASLLAELDHGRVVERKGCDAMRDSPGGVLS